MGQSFSLILIFIIFVSAVCALTGLLYGAFKPKVDGSINIGRVSKTIAFGVTIVFFYATFNGFFSLIINLFTSAIHLAAGTLKSADYQKQAIEFLNDISKFQYSTLILFMITWIIISICIEQVVQKDKSTQIPLFQDNRMAKNVFVCLILAFSVYLCIASIIAIPEFQALENDTVDKQEIQVFKNMLDDSTLNKRFDGPIVNVNLPSQSSLRYPSSLHRLNVVINALNLFKDRVESIKNDLNLKQQQIIVNYQTALDEKTALKQRSIYKSNLTNWFLEQQKIITVLSSEKDAINQYVPDRLSMINAIEKDTAKYGKDKTRIEVAYHESDVNYQELIQILNDNNNTLNEYMVNQQDMPERPNIGEEYGIFESMSGWLLKTESMSLALIVGLFGFGLLGAIGSSFIRQKITTDRPDQIEDYVPNLPVVLISGLSSAIVVFLAVKGAIVVFATKDANLNPYILFSTCLVAAVYSEDIWAWARKRLLATFNNKDGEGSGTGKQSDTSGTTS